MSLHHTNPERRVGPRAEQKRRWDQDARQPCSHPECDQIIWRGATLCREHEDDRRRAAMHARWTAIQRMWKQGLTIPEIGAELDITTNHVGVEMARMRGAGWDLPYRRRRSVAA